MDKEQRIHEMTLACMEARKHPVKSVQAYVEDYVATYQKIEELLQSSDLNKQRS